METAVVLPMPLQAAAQGDLPVGLHPPHQPAVALLRLPEAGEIGMT